MNNQELIEEIKKHAIYHCGEKECYKEGCTQVVDLGLVLGLVKQLDEPEAAKVPQCVAEKIEYFKKTSDWDLFQAMDSLFGDKEIREWLEDKNNQELFARAWLDGYEVEEEKKYYVRFKWIEDSYSYLTLIKHLHAWSLKNITLDKKFRTAHTRKQLEDAEFGWVFDCPGIEIEEVEG